MEEGRLSYSTRQANSSNLSTEAEQLSSRHQSGQASTGVNSATSTASDYQCAKMTLNLADALHYDETVGIDYGFLSPIVNTINENEKSCLALLCEMPVSKGLLRNVVLCFLANILKNFWQKDTKDIEFGTSDSLSLENEMQRSSRRTKVQNLQLIEAKISFLAEIEDLMIDLQHEHQTKNINIESRRPEFDKLKDSFATVIQALRVLSNESSYGKNAVQIEDSHSYVIKDYKDWRITLRGEVTPANVHLKKHAINVAAINEHCKADLCLCYETKVEDEWKIHAVFSVIELKELKSYNCPKDVEETLLSYGHPIHQAIAYSHALELSSRLERCGSREDCYSLVLYCGRGVNKSGLYCIEYCIKIPKLGGIYHIYHPFRHGNITMGSYETCNALLRVLIYGLRNIKTFKASKTLEVVSYLGKIPEGLKYISSPICDSLVKSEIQISQGCLFELPAYKLSWLKESLKLKTYNIVQFFDLQKEEHAADCESIENVYIKIIAPQLNGIAHPFKFERLFFLSPEFKDVLSRGLIEVWEYKYSHWFIMKVIQGKKIDWDILKDNWSKFWDFAIIFANNCTAKFTYLDLRPKLENLRFVGNEFVLLDYDSFGKIPYATTDGRYPKGEQPAIYVLRQVTAAIWATFKKIKERELIDKVWNIREGKEFEDFQEFCTPELDEFWHKDYNKLKIKDVKEVFYKVANTLSKVVQIEQILL